MVLVAQRSFYNINMVFDVHKTHLAFWPGLLPSIDAVLKLEPLSCSYSKICYGLTDLSDGAGIAPPVINEGVCTFLF
jgi:hypothetical protein